MALLVFLRVFCLCVSVIHDCSAALETSALNGYNAHSCSVLQLFVSLTSKLETVNAGIPHVLYGVLEVAFSAVACDFQL